MGMKKLRLAGIGGAFGVLVLAAPAMATPVTFAESSCAAGDAGNTLALACTMSGGPYGVITANVGGVDPADYFFFHWLQAGHLEVVIQNTLAATDETFSTKGLIGFDLALFTSGGSPIAVTFGPGSITTANSLAAGDYYLEVSAPTDPPFTADVFNLDVPGLDNPIGTLAGTVPEPGTIALFGTGLVLLARRRWNR